MEQLLYYKIITIIFDTCIKKIALQGTTIFCKPYIINIEWIIDLLSIVQDTALYVVYKLNTKDKQINIMQKVHNTGVAWGCEWMNKQINKQWTDRWTDQ